MIGTGHEDVPVVLQMPGNKADAVPCECLQKIYCNFQSFGHIKQNIITDTNNFFYLIYKFFVDIKLFVNYGVNYAGAKF